MVDFEGEHLGFMAGAANDDTVDTESQYFAWEASRSVAAVPPPSPAPLNARLNAVRPWDR
jgi:hypothetical protein